MFELSALKHELWLLPKLNNPEKKETPQTEFSINQKFKAASSVTV